MPTEVIVPKVDMVMETGTFVEWLVKEGGQTSKGDPLFVIITEKAAIEVESPADGILAGTTAKADDVLPVTTVIGYILAPGEELPAKAAPQPAAPVPAKVDAKVEVVAATVSSVGSDKVRATPVARRMAEELGVELSQISGRGPNGRVHKADVLAYQKPQASIATSPTVAAPLVQSSIPLPDARRKQVIPIAGARKVIAERMAQSAFTAPHINLSLRVDMTEAIRLRERVLEPLQTQTGQRVSFTAILARAVATVLPHHPYLNASLVDGNIILWDDVHLGIATSVEDSLIVPVIRESQSKSLGQIVTALADLTERGRSRRLTTSEMTGSTFTISNLGMYGIESFTAIINPPEAAILAVGRMVDTPVQLDGQIVFRPMMEITACADHRIADGATVARFLADLKAALENPYLLI
ncbi:pyruvate dehydrogenase E2 component (dihydrolipoamide acetyltransferase) [Anaerolineales bacterium]|nr:pyruvate dehydrogenase E2 component (dihydrolipoamide acetyltransferase) [Anaerolineales bacterium]